MDRAEAVEVLARLPEDKIRIGHQVASDRPVQPFEATTTLLQQDPTLRGGGKAAGQLPKERYPA